MLQKQSKKQMTNLPWKKSKIPGTNFDNVNVICSNIKQNPHKNVNNVISLYPDQFSKDFAKINGIGFLLTVFWILIVFLQIQFCTP